MVQARSPCGAEWVRELLPERSPDPVGGAGSSPVTGRRAIPGGNARRAAEWGPARTGSNEGGTAERNLRLRPFWDGGFLRLATIAVVRRQR
jgi:hypothetical protein